MDVSSCDAEKKRTSHFSSQDIVPCFLPPLLIPNASTVGETKKQGNNANEGNVDSNINALMMSCQTAVLTSSGAGFYFFSNPFPT